MIEIKLWYCEGCNAHGEVSHETGESIVGMLYRMNVSHHSASPGCRVDVSQLRVPRDADALAALIKEQESRILP